MYIVSKEARYGRAGVIPEPGSPRGISLPESLCVSLLHSFCESVIQRRSLFLWSLSAFSPLEAVSIILAEHSA